MYYNDYLDFMTDLPQLEQDQASSSFPPMGTNQSLDCVVASNAIVKYHPIKDAFLKEMDVGVLDVNKLELEQYLEEKRETLKCELSIFNWWKANKGKYKVLLHMARDVFAIPMSTVASESAFSTLGRVLDQFQSSLSSGVVQALICTQDWLRYAPTLTPSEIYLVDTETYVLALKAIDEKLLPLQILGMKLYMLSCCCIVLFKMLCNFNFGRMKLDMLLCCCTCAI
ncbi:zinc finger BED domain-containing protein RICESLEEPER 1-like [Pistacia vera]|uniref:zinc finger BED domain-containing protein RICESLEEPER 1-like n=1 Tax=Pistacia vera TaxID=55513 RepID=UPI001263C721|nr:zinc finger BED domain-containing protein RICESLEEPER 1-like [Pistacia vera]